jgi:hypothetical protein
VLAVGRYPPVAPPRQLQAREGAEKIMKKRNIAFFETGMLLGIFFSIFLVPRETSIRMFVLISVSIFVAGNILLFRNAKRAKQSGRYRMTGRAYLGLGLMVLFWALHFLWR